jgi:gamma-glutamyltranspeptidase/glutathione hydrolase
MPKDDRIYSKYERARSTYRPVVRGTQGVVSSGHHLATQAGVRILDKGGNAVDAGVAAGICLGILQPEMVNFAGVAPIMIYMADKRQIRTISGLGRWPAAVSVDYFLDNFNGEIPSDIQRTVVPAAPAAWIQALAAFGTMSFEEVTRDAIYLAESGFAVYPFLSNNLKEKADKYRRWPTSAEIYLPQGRAPEPGEVFVQKDLAETIKKMVRAEQKHRFSGRIAALQAARDVFYRREIAEAILDYHKNNNGLLRQEDMENFQATIEDPYHVTYCHDYEIYSCPPWCQGPTLLQALNLLERFDLETMGHNSPAYLHHVAEALKLAFSDREKFYGDPDFVNVPMQGLLSKDYAQLRKTLIDKDKAWTEMPLGGDPWRWQAGQGQPAEGKTEDLTPPDGKKGAADEWDTSYVCVVDKYGNAFSATPSDGSDHAPVIPTTGIVPSQRGSQSRVNHNHPSSIQGGKRPRLTPNPSIVLRKGKLFMPFGTPGGDVQCQAMLQVFLNIVKFGMDPQEAIEAPRLATYNFPSSFFPHAYNPGLLRIEPRVDSAVVDQLQQKGHEVVLWTDWSWRAGAVCAIVVDSDSGILLGAADPRRECYAMGW